MGEAQGGALKLPQQLIESVVSRYESRYTLQGVLFDAKKKLLIATDGHALAVIPTITEKNDETGIISARAWKLARALAKRIPKKMRVGAGAIQARFQVMKHKLIVRGHEETMVLPKLTGQFPEWSGLFGSIKPKHQITVNVDLLLQLSNALCEPGTPPVLTLFLSDNPQTAVGVMAFKGEGAGLLMPCRGDNSSFDERLQQLGIKKEPEKK